MEKWQQTKGIFQTKRIHGHHNAHARISFDLKFNGNGMCFFYLCTYNIVIGIFDSGQC